MKLLRYGEAGRERPGVMREDGSCVDVSGAGLFSQDWDFSEDFFPALAAWVGANGATAPGVPEGARLGPCVARPGKIVCVGLNFSDHAKESGLEPPAEPVLFMKASTSLCGPHDGVMIPRDSSKTDWEVELAVVIGQRASYVEEAEALDHVAGYCLHNDYSERAFQLERCGQWDKGKGCDTFAPLGPWLVTKDELPDVNKLRMWLKVNGEVKQDGSTANLIFKVPFLVSYISQFMTLLPGDIISTGTPAGVGLGFDPPQYLKPGDVIELGIDGLGTQTQVARAWSRS